MGYFDKINKQREAGTYKAPAQNATYRDLNEAVRRDNPALYNAVEQRRAVNMWNNYVQEQMRLEPIWQQRREEVAGQINSYFSVHGPGTNGGSPFARFTPGAQAAARSTAGASGVMDYQELDKRAKIAQADKRRQQQDKAKRDYEAAVAAYNQAIDRTTAATNEPMDEVWQGRMERAQAEEDAAKERVDAAKKALDESGVKNGIVQWQGRDALVKEYRQIQNRMESAVGRDNPAKIEQYRKDGARLEEIRKQLEELDQATGNGAVDYSGSDRFGSILTAAGGGIASSLEKTALTWADYATKHATDKFLTEDADEEYDYEIPVMQTVRDSYYSPESRAKWNRLYAAADNLGESAAADVERAKNGLGRLGQAGVDIAVNVLEMGFDAGVSALTGIPGLAVMGARVFGDSAGEARQNGATLEQQIGYGIAGAGIEVITEKLFDGVAGIYGKGAADNITETLVRRLSSTPTGQSLMRVILGAVSEGNEEVLSDLLHPLAEKIYRDDGLGQLYREIDPADVLYDFLIGAAVGGLYGTAGAVAGGGAANAENAYLTEMYQQRGEKPGFSREVRDRAILERQAENPAAYETRNMSAEENAQEAMKALRGQQTESQRAQELQQTQKAMASEGMGEMIRAVFSDDGVTLSDGEVKTLTEKAEEGEAGIRETVLGYREAYRMGENGDTWEDVVESVGKRYGLTPSQITYAWGYGRSVQTTESGTADISTEEGRTKAESRLAIFGERAQEALELMQPRQDVGRYASALNKAAYLYAANGVDVQQMAEQARSGKAADIVGYLTPEQAALAQRIGEEQRQRTEQSVKAMSAARTVMRQKAAALTQGETVTAGTLEQVDSALADARARAQDARKIYADNMAKLETLNRTSAKEWETEAFQTAYNEAVDKVSDAKEAIKQTEAEIRELSRKKAEAEGKKVIQRKKGTVSFGGGTVEGRRFEGVERDKLSRQQKKVVAMVESLADTINLDYVFFSGEAGTGGAYVQGGTVFVNVNAGLGVGGFSQTMAAASLSHELTHWLQEYAPEEYKNLKDFVISEVLKAGPQKLNELVKQQRAWEASRNLSYDAALDEVVANACQTMLLDSKAITELARQHMSTAQKIADYISDWAQKVKDAFAEVDTSQGAIYDSLRAVQGGLDRMQKLWDEGIKAASANYDAEQMARETNVAQKATNENAAQNIGDVKNQYIGENAEDIDHAGLYQAMQLEDEGMSNEDIRQETGWFRGMDGKWRFEIDDSEMKLRDNFRFFAKKQRALGMPLTNFIRHDKLFFNYPEIARVTVSFDIKNGSDTLGGWRGWKNDGRISGHISLNEVLLENGNENELLDTLSHEIQHAIQDWEWFARGSSPDAWERRINAGYDNRTASAKKAQKAAEEELEQYKRDNPEFYENMMALMKDVPKTERGKILDWDTLESEPDPPEWVDFDERRDALEEKYGTEEVFSFMDVYHASREDSGERRTKYDLYRNTAGEIEARDAAARRNLTAEQRRNTPPDLGNEDTVFAEGGAPERKAKFQMIGEVEETPRLVAVHNVTEEKLLPALKLGGLPVPSIAIVKAKSGHSNYGPISLVFAKKTIDPQVDRRNKVYGADAWTPMRADVEYQVNDDEVLKAEQMISDLSSKIAGGIFSTGSAFRQYGIEGNTSLDYEGMLQKLSSSDAVKAAYAAAHDVDVEPVYRQKEFSVYGNDALKLYIDRVGADTVRRLEEQLENGEWNLKAEDMQALQDTLRDHFLSKFAKPSVAERRAANIANNDRYVKFINGAYAYMLSNGETTDEVDRLATGEKLSEAVSTKDVVEWLKPQLTGIIGDPGIRNKTDAYTSDGRRRSFWQTHDTYTLANIVKAMTSGNARGAGIHLGATHLQSITATDYSNVESMKKDAKRLRRTTEEEYSAEVSAVDSQLEKLVNDIAAFNKDDSYMGKDIIGEVLIEAARGKQTVAGIQQSFKRLSEYTLSKELAGQVLAAYQAAANLPTEYFEAKPQRAVGFDEVLSAIIPDNASSTLKTALQGAGVHVDEYKAGDEADRLRKLNSVEGAQFQRWDDTSGDTAAESNGREDAYTRIEAENKAVADMVTALQKLTKKQQSTIDKLQKRLKLTKTPEVRTADANRMARELVKEYGARVDVSGISEQLKELGDYILQAKELDENEVRSRARAIAAEIVDNAVEQVSMEDETISAIAGSIKGRKFTISPDFLGELDQDGGFDAFRKRNFGSFTLAKADSQSIDRSEYISVAQAYADLQSEYGKGYFPDVANEGEEIRNIAAAVQAAVPMEVNPFEQYRGEAVEQLANQIAVDSMSGALRPTPPTDADRAKSTRDALKAQIKQLQKEGKIQEREAKDYERTIDELTGELDKAERRYRSLKITGERRLSQVRAEGRARQEEIKAKEREKAAEKIASLKEHYKQMRKDAGERRKNSGTRRKIRKMIDELNRRLKHPTENRHVPRELMQVTIEVLEMIDTGTGRASTKAAEKLADIRAMYERYKNDPVYGMAYDEVTADMLDQLALTVRGKRLMDMNETQLKAVYDTLKSLIHVIDTAVKIKIGTEERNAFELSRSMTQETRGISKAMRGYFREHFIPAHLRADVAFHRFGGFRKNSTWSQVARMLNDGQLAETRLKMELSRPFERIFTNEKALADFTGMNKFGRLDKSKLVDIGLKTEGGDAILVTHDMMVSIYLDLLNEDNRRHFINGGKTIPNLQDYYDGKGGWGAGSQRVAGISGRLSELNHQLSEAKGTKYGDWADDIKAQIDALKSEGEQYADEVQDAIEQQLTDYDRAWVTAIRQLMDVDSKRELNRTTMEVYGIQKANVPNYWPIFSDSDFLSAPMETIVKDMSLENVGFMKERVKGSNPTLALGSVQVVTRQIERVAHYCGMMPALRNFGKIWGKTQAGYSDSIKNAVHDVFQASGVQYIENLIADLTGARAEKRDFLGLDALLGKLRGNLAQTTLTLNPRVALAQAASYPTAAAELGWGPLRKALAHGGKDGRIISHADTELIAKWSPLLYLRMQGYSSPELGDIQSSTDLASRVWRKMRWATGWIQAVDGATVGRLWYASEYWVQEHKPTLQKGSDAYYEAVAEKFNAVVEKTQPNYTTMQRAAILRDPSSLVKTFTMFMTQRLQNFNILYDSVASYQVARADFANGRNGVTQEDVREARQTAARAVTSQLAQAAVYVAFKVIADMLLHNMKKYRDEDTGDFTAKSVSLAILDAYIDALIGVFAFGSELYGIGKAVMGVSKWYGLSVSGVDSVNDLIDSVVKLAQSDWKSAEGRAKAKGKLLKVGQNLAQAMGIPLTNGIKLGQAVYYHIKDAIDGRFGSFEAGFERTKKQNTEKLILALESGDKEQIAAMTGNFKDEKTALSAVKERLKDDYKNGLREAGEVESLLVRTGMDENDAWFYKEKMESGNDGRYTNLKAAVISGSKEAFEKELQDLTAHGVDKKDAFSALKTFLKNAYTGKELSEDEAKALGDKTLTAEAAQGILVKYTGMGENDAYLTVKGWGSGDGGKYTGALRAAFNGDQIAFKREIADLTSHGVKQKDVESQVKSFARNLYFGNEISEEQQEFAGGKSLTDAEARKMLVYYGGLSVDKANETVAGWKEESAFIAKHGAEYADYDLTTAQAMYYYGDSVKARIPLSTYAKQVENYGLDDVKSYYGKWQKTGLSIEQYQTYKTGAAACKGTDNDNDGKTDSGSKKAQMLQMINRLPVSSAVKDAIYLENGWAENGLYAAPWH